jgi:hypothetical protein
MNHEMSRVGRSRLCVLPLEDPVHSEWPLSTRCGVASGAVSHFGRKRRPSPYSTSPFQRCSEVGARFGDFGFQLTQFTLMSCNKHSEHLSFMFTQHHLGDNPHECMSVPRAVMWLLTCQRRT